MKLKHTNSIVEYFQYFCQISLKSILIILNYTISKLVHFFLRHSVQYSYICCKIYAVEPLFIGIAAISAN